MSLAPVVRRSLIPLLLLTGIASASASGPRLPDSGQTQQYDTQGKPLPPSESSLYTGQDASIQGAALHYVDNGDGTITDLNTGLMWQKAHDFNRRTLEESIEHVNNMTLGGHDDWRVPTIKELYSIADFDGS